MVNDFGSDATAAYGVGNQVLGYVQFPAMSIAIAASILGAQAIGAGHPERLGAITRTGLLINLRHHRHAAAAGLHVRAAADRACSRRAPRPRHIALRLLYIVLWSTLLFGCCRGGLRRDALQRHGAGADARCRSAPSCWWRVPVAWIMSGRIRHRRRVDGLSGHVPHHAAAAGQRTTGWCGASSASTS